MLLLLFHSKAFLKSILALFMLFPSIFFFAIIGNISFWSVLSAKQFWRVSSWIYLSSHSPGWRLPGYFSLLKCLITCRASKWGVTWPRDVRNPAYLGHFKLSAWDNVRHQTCFTMSSYPKPLEGSISDLFCFSLMISIFSIECSGQLQAISRLRIFPGLFSLVMFCIGRAFSAWSLSQFLNTLSCLREIFL